MKKLLPALSILLLMLPLAASASISVPWVASSTDKGFASPGAINGNFPSILVGATTSSATNVVKLTGNGTSTIANGLNITGGGLTIGTLSGILKAVAGALQTALVNLASDVTGTLPVGNGGTGQTSLTSSQLLYGNGTNGLSSVATSSANCSGSVSCSAFTVVGSVSPTITSSAITSAITALGPTGQTQSGATQTIATSTTGTDFTITASGNTQTFNLPTASASNRGALSSADWTTFNNKGSGTVTSIATNNGLTGGTITTSGTIGLAAITANSVLANATGGSAVPTALATSSLGIALSDTTGTLAVNRGGTGATTLSGVLKGNGTSAFTVAVNGTDYTLITANTCSAGNHVSAITAAGVITCSPDTGSGGTGLATTTPLSAGNLLEYSSSGAGFAFGVATGTVSNGTGISVTAGQSVIGSGLTITNTSPLSGLTASFPFSFSNPTLTWIGLATTSQPASSNILVSNGTNGIYGAATSTLTASSPLTGSFTQIGSGGSLGCQTASGSQAGCLASADWTTFNNKLSAAITTLGPTGQGQTGATQTLASTTSTTNGLTSALTIVGSGNTQTFTPSLSGTLTVPGGGTGVATLTGIAKGNGTSAFTAAANGTDYTLLSAQSCAAGSHISVLTATGGSTCTADTGGASLLTNSGANTFLNTGTNLQAPVLMATSTTATSTFAGDVVIGGTGNSGNPNPYLFTGTSTAHTPIFGRVAGDLIDSELDWNGVSSINVVNANVGPCAASTYFADGNNPTLGGYYGTFSFLNDGWTNGGGSGCGIGVSNTDKPEAVAIVSPTGEMDFDIASTTQTGVTDYNWNVNNVTKMKLTNAGNLGLSTSTPSAELSVQAVTAPINNSYFDLGSSTGQDLSRWISSSKNSWSFGTTTLTAALMVEAASTTAGTVESAYNGQVSIISGLENTTVKFFQDIDQWGHRITGGDAPVLSSCGTTPSFVGAANDNDMSIQVGSVSATACTATFAHAWPTAPTCNVTNRSMSVVNAMTYTVSSSAIVVSMTGLTSDILDVHCTGTQ